MARGWLRRKNGKLLYCWMAVRPSDGKSTERSRTLGEAKLSDKAAWMLIGKSGLDALPASRENKATINQVARLYLDRGKTRTGEEKAASTQELDAQLYRSYIEQRWGSQVAEEIKPAELQEWLDSLSRGVRPHVRNFLSAVYRFGQTYGMIPREQSANPMPWVSAPTTTDYEAITITPEQAFSIVERMPLMERTITVLIACTAMRISEALALKWEDVDWLNMRIFIRRGWVRGKIGKAKSKASRAPVPMHEALANVLQGWRQETAYAQDSDFVFASSHKRGKQPRRGDMLVQDYIRPCAIAAGVIAKDTPRFGFHNLRHSLASFLISRGHDPKVVQRMLRHSDLNVTLEHYAHIDDARRIAQGEFVEQFFPTVPDDLTSGMERV